MFFDMKLSCALFIATVSFILQQLFDPVIHFLVWSVDWMFRSLLLSRFELTHLDRLQGAVVFVERLVG